MSLEVYLYFNGNCREAVEFYADVFGAEKQKMLTYGEAPADPDFVLPDEAKNRILHTILDIGAGKIMFSDCPPGMEVTTGSNVSIVLNYEDKAEMKKIFDKLAGGGNIRMELAETFFSKYYGFLTDRFGVLWQMVYMGK